MNNYKETISIFQNELNWCNNQIKNGRNDLVNLKNMLENIINKLIEKSKINRKE